MTDPCYDITGHGPVLLLLPGGAGHPMGLGPLTQALCGHFTVVTYDPLGLAHGRLGEPVADQRVQDWSDGARRVLDETLAEGGTAYVLGTSAGAVAALDLAARHAERLRHVVAHEPPCVGVLPDGARQRAAFREVCAVYRARGLAAAGALMTAVLEERDAGELPAGQPLSREEELTTPMALALAHVIEPFTSYVPEAGPSPAPLTVAAGADSRGQLLYRTAEYLAKHLQADFAEFPGGHLGVLQHPEEFAERLTGTLLGAGPRS
ncbi:pimeloyl-ACP methyl ester carboxylesterase [Streptomyces sp. SAI-208]|uniref:alpha/beta fold hydrolase n=1 Tax=Streptomyces sp. SAI-208 TaxID=2940550 RepID=UPI0024751E1E|nr:alpha/beta hydrolase [Streptomyces sp. SAI-208]MDH6606512.1 pimeloyl-ACP methyl ester carboxylesterase [Streptomyces sp. SAI-208]